MAAMTLFRPSWERVNFLILEQCRHFKQHPTTERRLYPDSLTVTGAARERFQWRVVG